MHISQTGTVHTYFGIALKWKTRLLDMQNQSKTLKPIMAEERVKCIFMALRSKFVKFLYENMMTNLLLL